MSYHHSPALLHYLVKLLCSKIVNYIVDLYYERLMAMNNYTIKSFVVLIRAFSVKLVNKSAYRQWVTNDVLNVHRQPAHMLSNDDATDESLL